MTLPWKVPGSVLVAWLLSIVAVVVDAASLIVKVIALRLLLPLALVLVGVKVSVSDFPELVPVTCTARPLCELPAATPLNVVAPVTV